MKPQNMHITLNFLGDINDLEIEHAQQILAEVAERHKTFSVNLDEVKQERDMLWIMPSHSVEIDSIQEELKSELKHSRLGKRERRSFEPHVLVAKSKTGRFMKWKPDNFQRIKFDVSSINLYESELTPGAATHRLIQKFNLRAH